MRCEGFRGAPAPRKIVGSRVPFPFIFIIFVQSPAHMEGSRMLKIEINTFDFQTRGWPAVPFVYRAVQPSRCALPAKRSLSPKFRRFETSLGVARSEGDTAKKWYHPCERERPMHVQVLSTSLCWPLDTCKARVKGQDSAD